MQDLFVGLHRHWASWTEDSKLKCIGTIFRGTRLKMYSFGWGNQDEYLELLWENHWGFLHVVLIFD